MPVRQARGRGGFLPDTWVELAGAGFLVDDVREAPDRPGKELVFIARRND